VQKTVALPGPSEFFAREVAPGKQPEMKSEAWFNTSKSAPVGRLANYDLGYSSKMVA